MKLLEDEADFSARYAPTGFAEFRKIDAGHDHMAGGERVQAAENVDERGFPEPEAHERDPFAGVHAELTPRARAACPYA